MLISIIIPVYNEINTIIELLELIQRSPIWRNNEKDVIVIDDNSIDGISLMPLLTNEISNDERIIYSHWKGNVSLRFQEYRLDKDNNLFDVVDDQSQIFPVKNDSIKNKLNNKIKFINYTNQIQTLYKNSDIFILPSLTEGMPNSLLEAMSSGLPCIATNLKNITTNIIKNGKCGFLFKKNDLLDLKVKIEKLLNFDKK